MESTGKYKYNLKIWSHLENVTFKESHFGRDNIKYPGILEKPYMIPYIHTRIFSREMGFKVVIVFRSDFIEKLLLGSCISPRKVICSSFYSANH